jgi:predicted SnoaL-like aldol condensation-catalyzing enzyme
MRKKLLAVSVCLVCVCFSCNNRSTNSDDSNNNSQARKNLDAWHVVSMAFANGNQNAIDSVIADDYLDHTSQGDFRGQDSVKSNIARWHTNLTNLKMERIKEFADNDYAVFWMRFTGNSNGKMGIPAGPFDMTTVQLVKFRDGKAIEHWNYMDMRDVMSMMSQMRIGIKTDSGKIRNR